MAGTYRGVGLGDSKREIANALGPPPHLQPELDVRVGPIENWEELNFPNVAPPTNLRRNERVGVLRYPRVGFLLTRKTGAYAIEVSDPGAATTRGLRIGDSLDKVRELYSGMECGVQNENTEYEPFPYCSGQIAKDRHIWFSDDPVELITVTIRPMIGPDFGPE